MHLCSCNPKRRGRGFRRHACISALAILEDRESQTNLLIPHYEMLRAVGRIAFTAASATSSTSSAAADRHWGHFLTRDAPLKLEERGIEKQD
jgi:hypothetical protein